MTDDTDPFDEGYESRRRGERKSDCPYPPDTDYGGYSDFGKGVQWLRGWEQADEEITAENNPGWRP